MKSCSGMVRSGFDRFGGVRAVVLIAVVLLSSATAQAQQGRGYGSNFGWSYSTPRTTYYNGPAIGLIGPYGPYPYSGYGYGYGYGGGGGGNVQYFRSGRTAFAVETYRDRNGRLRQRTGVFYYGGR